VRIGTNTDVKTETFAFLKGLVSQPRSDKAHAEFAFALSIRQSTTLFRLPPLVNSPPRPRPNGIFLRIILEYCWIALAYIWILLVSRRWEKLRIIQHACSFQIRFFFCVSAKVLRT